MEPQVGLKCTFIHSLTLVVEKSLKCSFKVHENSLVSDKKIQLHRTCTTNYDDAVDGATSVPCFHIGGNGRFDKQLRPLIFGMGRISGIGKKS